MLHRITKHGLVSLKNFTKPNLARNISATSFPRIISNQKWNSLIPVANSYSLLDRNTVFASPILSAKFSTKKSPDEDLEDELAEEVAASATADFVHTHLPATVAIPEVWPHLPVIATKRNPVFPRFMKILEASISLIFCLKRNFLLWTLHKNI